MMPERLGRYRLLGELGKGAMATVYHAVQEGPHGFESEVALKLVKPALIRRYPKVVKMLVDEARIASRVRHPNTVRILDLVEEDERLYMIMDFVDGLSMREVLDWARAEDEPPPVAPVIEIMAMACEGLHAAHQATDAEGKILGLVHRDVKPGNVLVSAKGEVKIADFGIALFGDRFADATAQGQLKGTPAYMSPEQALSGPLDPRSDIFSAGLTLYTLVTARLAFIAQAPRKVAMMIVNESLEPHIEEVEAVLPGLGDVLSRACAKDPDERYATAEDLARALRKLHATVEKPTSISTLVHAAGWRPRGQAQQTDSKEKTAPEPIDTESASLELSLDDSLGTENEPAEAPIPGESTENPERTDEFETRDELENTDGDASKKNPENEFQSLTDISQFGSLDILEDTEGVIDESTFGGLDDEPTEPPEQNPAEGELLLPGEGPGQDLPSALDLRPLDEPTQPIDGSPASVRPSGSGGGFVPPPQELDGHRPVTSGPQAPIPPPVRPTDGPPVRTRSRRAPKPAAANTGKAHAPDATRASTHGQGRPIRDYRGRVIRKPALKVENTRVSAFERAGVVIASLLLLGAIAAILFVQLRGDEGPHAALTGVPLNEESQGPEGADPFEAALDSVPASASPAASPTPPKTAAAKTPAKANSKPVKALKEKSADGRGAPDSAAPNVGKTAEVSVQGTPKPKAQARRAPERPTRADEATPPVPMGTGSLTVSTYPYSRIFVDGEEVGASPLLNHSLPAGPHQLRLVFPTSGDKTLEEAIVIRNLEETKIVRKLPQEEGRSEAAGP